MTVQPLTIQNNLTQEQVRNTANYQSQAVNSSKSSNNQNNSYQNLAPLPIVKVTPPVNSSTQTRSFPLPLANNSSGANSTSQKPNQANQNSIVSNSNAVSSPRIIASSSPPTQTYVSPMKTQPKIDLDAISSKVERKIMRRLVIEKERRGKIR